MGQVKSEEEASMLKKLTVDSEKGDEDWLEDFIKYLDSIAHLNRYQCSITTWKQKQQEATNLCSGRKGHVQDMYQQISNIVRQYSTLPKTKYIGLLAHKIIGHCH